MRTTDDKVLQKDSRKPSLKDYSTMELFKELTTRNGVHIYDCESERSYILEYPMVRRTLTLEYKYNVRTGEIVE